MSVSRSAPLWLQCLVIVDSRSAPAWLQCLVIVDILIITLLQASPS